MSDSDREWEVWVEGCRISGEHIRASLKATIKTGSFEQACQLWAASLPPAGRGGFDHKELKYFGAQLFDNETDARRKYG